MSWCDLLLQKKDADKIDGTPDLAEYSEIFRMGYEGGMTM